MELESNLNGDDGNISPQLPSFVDVVFILLIFFIVLSVVGFGVLESGSHSEGIFEKEQDLSEFPAVNKALQKELNEALILSLNVDDLGIEKFHVFSTDAFHTVIIHDIEEYKIIRTKIENNTFQFNGGLNEPPLRTLEATWGPFPTIEAMSDSRLVQNTQSPNLVIQADENFTYHQILQVLRNFQQFKSVYFEVIENGTNS